MILGIVLCGLIQHIYIILLVMHFTNTPMTQPVLAYVIMHNYFLFILGVASSIMNGIFYKKNLYKRNMVGFWFSIVTVFLCLLLFVYWILYRQAWFR